MKRIIFFITLLPFTHAAVSQDTTFREFYKSGKLKKISHEGLFNGCYMKIGRDSMFAEKGNLLATIHYDNRKDKKEAGCHATWTTELHTYFYPNGKVKARSFIKYSYQGEACDCGEWIEYDEKGSLKKKTKKTDCYDQQPCKSFAQ